MTEKVEPKVAFDLDGVLAVGTIKRNRYNMYEVYRSCLPNRLDKSHPNADIITGRKIRFRNVTTEWLDKHKFKYNKIHFYEGKEKTFDLLAEHKIKLISELGIEIYYEDTPSIAAKIAVNVFPKCKVYLIYDGHLIWLDVK